MRTIPPFVTRLLDDLGQSHLAGDLAEELHTGRSPVWVWWQVSAAVVRGFGSIVRINPYLTFRAIAVGWITVAVLNGLIPFSPHPEVGMWVHQSSAWPLLIAAQYLLAGWVVARLHPRHRLAMVLAATMFLTLMNGATVVNNLYFVVRFGQPLGVEMSAMMALSLATDLFLPLMTMVGGMWGPPPSSPIENL